MLSFAFLLLRSFKVSRYCDGEKFQVSVMLTSFTLLYNSKFRVVM